MRQDPPSDLIHQYKEVTHRLQWQKAQLERASPDMLSGNTRHRQEGNPILASVIEEKNLPHFCNCSQSSRHSILDGFLHL